MPNEVSVIQSLKSGASAIVDKVFDNPYKKLGLSWLTLRKSKYLSAKGLNSLKLFGNDIFFYNRTEYLIALKEIFVDEIYKQSLPPNSYIIDCGSNIGLSVIYLKKLCPTATVVAFEPDSKNFDLLKKNVASFNLESVELKNQAVWTSNTTLSFISEGSMSSRIGETKGTATHVEAIRLKELLTRKVDFLKIDIEGAEFEVLKDIKDNLHHVTNMFFEYHGSFDQNKELSKVFSIITNAGFNYYLKEAGEVYNSPFTAVNTLRTMPFDIQLNIFCFRLNNHASTN